jgi:hypothetical protein
MSRGIDEQELRRKLREELGSLEISPAPVLRVTRRGRGVRARRRAVTGGTGLAAALVVALAASQASGGQAAAPQGVTLNAPDPAAPGGVFASGTVHGKPWRLAVRNVDADPGTPWCLPAVMFNGRDGDVLFPRDHPGAALGDPAVLSPVPGTPGISAVFIQVGPHVTALDATFTGGRGLTVRPVWVAACTQRFHLAGFVFAGPPQRLSQLGASGRGGSVNGMVFSYGPGGGPARGIWVTYRAGKPLVAADSVIGRGRILSSSWAITESVGQEGQCYAILARDRAGGRGQARQCVPVSLPPRATALALVSVSTARVALPGYAGLVNPRAAKVVVNLSGGITLTLRPVNVAGRAYIAFVPPVGCAPYLLSLFDSAGHRFAISTTLPSAK